MKIEKCTIEDAKTLAQMNKCLIEDERNGKGQQKRTGRDF